MQPKPSIPAADPRFALLRAAFVATGLAILLTLLFAPAMTLFLAGLALAIGLGEGFARLRRRSATALTGADLLREHE